MVDYYLQHDIQAGGFEFAQTLLIDIENQTPINRLEQG